jgi:hydroxymethylpyrimidine/phosphomethylpyrimidine kinase
MINSNNKKPVVMVIAGHDPSGGAGIQADIESIANAGCHAATVITALTAQNTKQVADVIPQEPESFRKQIKLILEDMEIAACKIGMIGSIELIDVIQSELSNIDIPLVLDPVLAATSGRSFTDKNMCEKILSSLFPLASIVTPNSEEARALSQSTDLNTAANKLLTYGTKAVLITGADENTNEVINSFYTKDNAPIDYKWQRIANTFHGSGCTLSSRIAALLALGNDLKTAIEEAQAYTWNTLKHGLTLGQGQAQPDRFYDK